jgi:tRNA A37 threonylcarbamoyladenosine synthetase subunit TsaC/SUA5/YrdC
LRVPDHTTLQALLALHEGALLAATLIAPGESDPMNDASAIRDRFEKLIAGVIDAGACAQEPTTVIDLTDSEPQVIRQGRGDLARLGL